MIASRGTAVEFTTRTVTRTAPAGRRCVTQAIATGGGPLEPQPARISPNRQSQAGGRASPLTVSLYRTARFLHTFDPP